MDSNGTTAVMTPKRWATIVYCLQALGFLFGVSWVIGVVINYVMSDAVSNDPTVSSHFRYQIRTFWYGLAMLVISSVLWFTIILAPVAFLGYVFLAIWAIYRIVKGAVSLSENRAL